MLGPLVQWLELPGPWQAPPTAFPTKMLRRERKKSPQHFPNIIQPLIIQSVAAHEIITQGRLGYCLVETEMRPSERRPPASAPPEQGSHQRSRQTRPLWVHLDMLIDFPGLFMSLSLDTQPGRRVEGRVALDSGGAEPWAGEGV